MSHQMILDLPYQTSYHPSDFIVSNANRAAHAWVLKWPHWSSHGLVIWGEHKCGKRHLSAIWQDMTSAIVVDWGDDHLLDYVSMGQSFIFHSFLNEGQVLSGAQWERLFHFLNTLKEKGGFVLITSTQPPRHWPIELADLKSRMMALDSCSIGALGDDLLVPLLMKLFSDAQMTLSDSLLAYTAARITRSYGAVCAFVQGCYWWTLETQKPLSFKGVRDLLAVKDNR